LKGARLDDLKDALDIWIWQVNVNNGTATDEVIKEQVKVLGQQMSVKSFEHKKWYVLGLLYCYKLQIHTPQFCLSFAFKFLTAVYRIPYDTLIH
jgi:hypothetical protein